VDEMMSWRAHRYSSRLLEDWSLEHPGQRLPPVIVLVLYHGQAEWTAPEELEELFALDGVTPAARDALRPYLPKQRYLLEVVPEDPTDVRSGPGIARLTLITLKLGRSADRWMVIFECREDLQDLLSKGKPGLHYLGLLVQYVMMVNPEATQESLSEVLKPMGTEAQALPKTYGMRLVEQGVEQGRREALMETARRLLAKGMSPAEVADATDLPLEEVQKLAH
jgi:hypothetical protein